MDIFEGRLGKVGDIEKFYYCTALGFDIAF